MNGPRPAEQALQHQLAGTGQQIHVSVRPGAETGPVLLLCNGIGANLGMLQPFVDALDERITVIRFDAPGVGQSPPSAVPYRFSTLAWGLGRMLGSLGHDRFDVLGISWGGGLAQQIALQHPRRCRRLVLTATGTGALMVPSSPRVLAALATPRRYHDLGYAEAIAADLYGGRVREQPGLLGEVMGGHARAAGRGGYLLQLLAGWGWTSLPLLPLIRQPTLILAGDDDPIIRPVNGRIMLRLLPNAALNLYHDGHLGLVTAADELGPLVSRFLRD